MYTENDCKFPTFPTILFTLCILTLLPSNHGISLQVCCDILTSSFSLISNLVNVLSPHDVNAIQIFFTHKVWSELYPWTIHMSGTSVLSWGNQRLFHRTGHASKRPPELDTDKQGSRSCPARPPGLRVCMSAFDEDIPEMCSALEFN